jgi:hypothetical protein
VIATLPIAFVRGRGGACLYIPWFGWALWIAVLGAALCNYVSKAPLFRRLLPNWARAIPLMLLVAVIWYQTDTKNKKILPGHLNNDAYFWSVKEQLNALLPIMRSGAQIAFYNDGRETWDAKFITKLVYRDKSLQVWMHRYQPLRPEEFDKMDYVLNIDEKEKLTILKRPGESFKIPTWLPVPTPK